MNAANETILGRAHEVLLVLESCASDFTGRSHRLAETQRDRFRLWSDNVGVFAPSHHASLDNRLQQAPELTKALFGILRNLHAQAIRARDATAPEADVKIGSETAVPDSVQPSLTDDSKLDNIREHNLRKSDETIEWLFRFSRVIRQGGTRDPLSKGGLRDPLSRVSEFKIVEDFEDFEAVRGILHQTALTENPCENDDRLQDWLSKVVPDTGRCVIDFITYNKVENKVVQEDIGTMFDRFVREVMKTRLPKKDDGTVIDEWLHDRLSEAICLRRKHFLYVREHQRKLKASLRPAHQQEEDPGVKRNSQAPSSAALTPKLLSESRPGITEVISSVHSGTTVSFLPSDDFVPQPAPSPAFSAASSYSIKPTKCEIPPAPRLQVGAREHQCPYCCLVWPAEEFTNEERWKHHVIRDLRPYVCLYRNCPFPEELFASFRDWRRHMQKPHETEWVCPVYTRRKKAQKATSEVNDEIHCGGLELNKQPWLYQTQAALENHMKACHSDLFSASQVSALAGRSKRTSRPLSECLFGCAEFVDAFYKHVAAHLQDFALMSLPWRDDVDSKANSDNTSTWMSTVSGTLQSIRLPPLFDELPNDKDFNTLASLLRTSMQDHPDGPDKSFLPRALLHELLSMEAIQYELGKYGWDPLTIKNVTLKIMVDAVEEREENSDTYLVVFAILLLLGKGLEIRDCIFSSSGICDQDLPLLLCNQDGDRKLQRRDKSEIGFFNDWSAHLCESFDAYQWRLTVPTFAFNEDNTIRHEELRDEDILPWCKELLDTPHPVMFGGFADVARVRIHPYCHRFHDVLKEINVGDGIFAVKTLRAHRETKFAEEVDMLRRFNGLVHPHLVTLLATFSHKGRFHMLFPWAEYDLNAYWRHKNPNPNPQDLDFVLWISNQCRGIMEAVETIHHPKHLPNDKMYGIHGDIQPGNILWYESPYENNKGILVISGFGLASFNREESIISNRLTGCTPTYRPPEYDLEGGTISRPFDIWTLGCVYLELICWLLGGWKAEDDFQRDRATTCIMGWKDDVFFDLRIIDGESGHDFVMLVKPQVVKKINDLHNHERCTQYIHEFLDIIENDMLVVLSGDRQRQRSPVLLKKLNDMHNRCCDDRKYCLQEIPIKRPSRVPTGTVVKLNVTTTDWIAKHDVRLQLYPGSQLHKSLEPEELENIDRWG